jgi:hypothetical protein
VFTLTVDPDGSWQFTLLEPIDHASPTWPGSGPEPTTILDLSGFVRAVDFDGDAISLASGTAPSTSSDFSITITDDVPALIAGASASTGTVDEGALSFAVQGSGLIGDFYGSGNDHGVATAAFSGSLSGLVSFGADGATNGGGFRLVDAATATAWLKSLNLFSHNVLIDLAVINGNILDAWTGAGPGQGNAGAHKVFTLILNGDGSYSFQLINPIDDPNPGHGTPGPANEDTVTVDLSGLVKAVDFDGDAVSLSSGTPSSASDFHVTVVDDVPVVLAGVAVTASLDESTVTSATHVTASAGSGSLSALVSFGADGPAGTDFKFVAHADAVNWLQTLHLTSNGSAVDKVTSTGSVLTASAEDGHNVFTLTLSNDGSWALTLLAPIDHVLGSVPIDLAGFVQAVDFDGDAVTLSNDFKINVTGTPEPTITAPDLNIAVNVPAGSAADPHAAAGNFSIPVLSLLGLDSDSQGLPLSVQVIAFGNTPGEGLGVTNGVPDGNYIQLPYGAAGTSETFSFMVTDSAGASTIQHGTINFVNFSTALTSPVAGVVDASNGFNFLIDNTSLLMEAPTGNAVLLANGVAHEEIGGASQHASLGGGNDLLVGSELANDFLIAGDGNDTLWGRGGGDTLLGSTHAGSVTTFYYANPLEGNDTIENFDVAGNHSDVIAISASGFNAQSPFANLVVTNDVSSIFTTAAPTAAMSNERFFSDGAGTLSYSYDGTSTHLVTLAHVTNHTITAGDIHVVA